MTPTGLLCLLTTAVEYDFWALGSVTKGWVPGQNQTGSGLIRIASPTTWEHVGYMHPYITALDYDPRDPATLYLASGNGLIRASNAGRDWRIMTSWDMTEALGVAVQGRDILLALPDGIGFSSDAGRTWTRRQQGLRRKFTQVVRYDRSRTGRAVAGTESGVFVSSGGAWKAAGAFDAMIFDLAQSPHDPAHWLAVAQDGRVFESTDNAESWRVLASAPKVYTLYNIAFDPTRKGRIALGGWSTGVLVSEDGGASWRMRNNGLPKTDVWRVRYHPTSGTLYAYVHETGLFASGDQGVNWTPHGLPGGVVRDLVFTPHVDAPRSAPRPLAAPVTRARFQQPAKPNPRREQIIRYHAGPSPQPDPNYGHYSTIAAKLYLRQDPEWCSQRLRALLKEPSGDMFWMFPVAAIEQLDRGQLSAEARADLRKAWRDYFPYRGDTENHWLLYYASLYLTSQMNPNAEWFTGKTSRENMRESAEYIRHWIDLTLDKGQGEYDCTHYIGVFLLPLSFLAEWAEDKDLRTRARMMIEYIMADFAAELLDGLYAGSHARTDDRQVLERSFGVSSEFAWLFFGQGSGGLPIHSGYSLYYSLASGYEPPPILVNIANDRAQPYTHLEKKRTRHRWRFHDEKNGPVYKTTYMTRNYAVGSDQGGVLQPIQQHSWDVTWRVPNSAGVHNTLFTTHPYSSGHELQTYFTPMPDYFLDEVLRSKKTYDSPDKWIGGSPHERIVQDQDTVIALYDIPEGVRFPHIHGFFSKDLRNLKEDRWIFAEAGDAYIAYYPLAPYEWRRTPAGDRELFSPHGKNGAIVQVADRAEFTTLNTFIERVQSLRLLVSIDPVPSVTFESLRGSLIEFTFGLTPRINGKPLDYASWPMFDSPFVKARQGSRTMELRHGKMRRILDFNNLTMRDRQE